MNGVDKYATESMLTMKELDMACGTPIAKARPRQKPTVTLTSVSIPVPDQSVPRGSDGAIYCSDTIEKCRMKKFYGASQWLLEDWISTLAKGGGAKKRFQYCVNPKLFQSIPVPSSNSRTCRRQGY